MKFVNSGYHILYAMLFLSASPLCAADYDYEVEFVKSTGGSAVRTELIPDAGLSFRLKVMFEGSYNQIFSGKFDRERQTTAFFGQEETVDSKGFRNLFTLSFGGHEAQT